MSFSIFLNSVNGSGATSSSTYQINWNNINTNDYQGKYKLWFNFQTVGLGLTTSASTVPYITTNIGATQDFYTANGNNGTANNRVLGYVYPAWAHGANHTLSAMHTDNAPVILESKPSNNQFTVNLYNMSGTAFTDIDAVEYYLVLYFEKYE
jgi:hypothetical protein